VNIVCSWQVGFGVVKGAADGCVAVVVLPLLLACVVLLVCWAGAGAAAEAVVLRRWVMTA
jgi:hypothetical protein